MKMCLLAAALAAASIQSALGQGFDTGSTGALGALNVVDANVTVDLPPDGRLHYTTVNVASGRVLKFNKNALNTPVYLLAQGDVVIDGTIDISGGQAPSNIPIGGAGGPGGFNGGNPAFGEFGPGDGYGPGAGGGGITGNGPDAAGGGGYGARGTGTSSTKLGATYGSPLLIPLIGGSGGGGDTGSPGLGGGGGGGAILVASNSKVAISGAGVIDARGGTWQGRTWNGGSGGAIRLLAPRVEGNGNLYVNSHGPGGGVGRIRVDTLDKTSLRLQFNNNEVTTVGANMFVEPPNMPRLDIVEAAGQTIAVGTGQPVRVTLPFGSDNIRDIVVQASGFGAEVPIRLTLTPDSGPRIDLDATIDNRTQSPARAAIRATLPVNTLVTINAWTR